ncbi:MATE family efflux transporter [Pectobacterium brasiliense]|uniref:MATE family efflux transporter n=1 Tax=Pectobacterium brasiliense TaxID=180957 RepID=UPI001968B61C|nr:lipopolysaccharide biosynthesis protein [Pectobacterium brasiliense]MBN3229616.1 lipopolysaccharide biosynthesis protein [Pectobacterium brasiliense]
MNNFYRLAKNSVANIINGFSNLIMGIVISPFLISRLTIDEFSVWSLILQIAAFFSLLGFGTQLAVSRYVTLASVSNKQDEVRLTIRNGVKLSTISVAIAFLCLIAICFYFKEVFSDINYDKISNVEVSFFTVSCSFIFGLWSSVFCGYFSGVEKNEIPAVVNFISRFFIGAGVVYFSSYGILAMSVFYFFLNLLSYFAIFILYKKESQLLNVRNPTSGGGGGFKEFLSYCLGISVFNFSMFLITGFNSFLVGKFSFNEFAYYSLAMPLVLAAIGFLNAGIMPVLQPFIRLLKTEQHKKVADLTYILTVLILTLTIIVLIIAFYIGKPMLSLWIGGDLSEKTYGIFLTLLGANLVRMIGAPLGLVYIAEARQNEIMYLPLAEGMLCVLLSILLISRFDMGVYAIPIGVGFSAIVILFIYAFKLINILRVNNHILGFRFVFTLFPVVFLSPLIIFIINKGEIFRAFSLNISVFIILILLIAFFFYKIREIRTVLVE